MDWNYINTLLSVIHQASAAGPKYAKVASAADAELQAYMTQPVPDEVEDASEPELETSPEPEEPSATSERRV